ncbi:cell wall-binding repeat-containing protein [Catenulispora sp. NF23]|uniref:cell wall-binding repeat-containing protein n=1 Tax=Catenulispora pinistramenti TaxID=2705254 RepID=UPI001BA7A45B|nr:cell wall-binding repeat-containing protein [Catenulispora pinistramenti]MBS2539843.1 cell wall-binding repeat-containing protein [Catenulispora pinistramenti]
MSAKKLTAVAATALAAATSLAMPAHATNTPNTFPGLNGKLTVSTGDNQLHFAGGSGTSTESMPSPKVTDAEWSPDGSRVAYVDQNGNLITARYDGSDPIVVAANVGGVTHPTWMNGGSFLVYAQGGNLYQVPSLGGSAPVVLAAGHQPGDEDSAPQGGANGALVFQRIDAQSKRSEIWIYNGYTNTSNLVPNSGSGSYPALSPDARTIVFSKLDSQVPAPATQLWTVNADGSNLTQLTSDPGGAVRNVRATWSPDGGTIAFDAAGTGELMTMAPTAGAKENPVGELLGRITWQPNGDTSKPPSTASNPVNLVERLDGPDRIGTADQVSGWSYANQQANVVVLARQDIFADALAGSALAARFHGPLLLTPTGNLDPRTLAEMKRVLKPGAFVYVLGQTQAISAKTFEQVAAAGFRPTRIGGQDRFQTAVDIAETIVPDYSHNPVTILTATGLNYPDALAAGAVAGSRPNTVVVLTSDKKMPPETQAFLNAVPQRTVFGVGGEAVSALSSARIPGAPVFGADRFVTASIVAHTFFGGPQVVGIATGYNFPDALAGGALAGSVGGPLLLTGPTGLPSETADYLRSASGSVSDAVMFGGPAVIDDGLQNQVGDLIGQPGQWEYAENNPSAHVGPR